jgi:hypothetical protein
VEGRSNPGRTGAAFKSDYGAEGRTRGDGSEVFESRSMAPALRAIDVKSLHADAGEGFFRGCAHQGGIAERKTTIDREHDLPITKRKL